MFQQPAFVLAHQDISPTSLCKHLGSTLDRVTIDCLRDQWLPSVHDHAQEILYFQNGWHLVRFLLEAAPALYPESCGMEWLHIIGGGTVFPKGNKGWREFSRDVFKEEKSFLEGMVSTAKEETCAITHIIYRQKPQGHRIYLHPQWLSLRWSWWLKSLPTLKEHYLTKKSRSATLMMSEKTIHGDYTPLDIYLKERFPERAGFRESDVLLSLGSEDWKEYFMASLLDAGAWVSNVDNILRGFKYFLYTDVPEKTAVVDDYLKYRPGQEAFEKAFEKSLVKEKKRLIFFSRAGGKNSYEEEILANEQDGYLQEALKNEKMKSYLNEIGLSIPGIICGAESSTLLHLPLTQGNTHEIKNNGLDQKFTEFEDSQGKSRRLYRKLATLDVFGWREICEELYNRNLFVEHRAGYGTHGWKSFVVHGLGYDKTSGAEKYGYSDDTAPYQFTKEAEEFANSIVQFFLDPKKALQILGLDEQHKMQRSRFARIRIMLLEPGGYISPHNDTVGLQYELRNPGAINIAINQPENCHFYIWRGKHASNKSGAAIIPFGAGDAFQINVSCAHSVINNSQQRRYHMIVHLR